MFELRSRMHIWSSLHQQMSQHLTHWGRDKNDWRFAVVPFSNQFLMKIIIIDSNSIKFVPKGPIKNSVGADNGLVSYRRQAIIWTYDGLVYCRIYVSIVFNELIVQSHTLKRCGDYKKYMFRKILCPIDLITKTLYTFKLRFHLDMVVRALLKISRHWSRY